MNIKVLRDKDLFLSFLVEGTDDFYMNAIRRLIQDEVPTMAIEEVEFKKNDSALYDEIIALRLGLLSLKTDLKGYTLPADCTCQGAGCAKCTLDLTLKTTASGYIKADKMKSKDPAVVPVYPETPIAYLTENQILEFSAKAVLGKGKVHAKWSPGLASYRHKPEIKIDKTKSKGHISIVNVCSKKVLEEKNGAISIAHDKLMDCDLNMACVAAGPKGAIEVTGVPDAFIFTLESWGQLSTKEIFETAIAEFDKKLDEFTTHLKAL